MKREIFYILTLFILFAGCMREDLSDCYTCPENLILLFAYPDYDDKKDGSDVFEERIKYIDVILYNSDLNSYLHLEIDPEELGENRSKALQVEPGEYYIVSWANQLSSREKMPITYQDTRLGENLLYHDNTIGADPLHYAPDTRNLFSTYSSKAAEPTTIISVNVPPASSVTHTLSYMSAHRTLNIYLKGFPDITEQSDNNPEIIVSNLTLHYNDLLERSNEFTNYRQNPIKTIKEKEAYGYTTFYLPLFDLDNNIILNIKGKNAGKSYNYFVTMEQILQQLEITELTDGDNLVIEVVIEFKGAYVEVKRPGWGVIGVTPSL